MIGKTTVPLSGQGPNSLRCPPNLLNLNFAIIGNVVGRVNAAIVEVFIPGGLRVTLSLIPASQFGTSFIGGVSLVGRFIREVAGQSFSLGGHCCIDRVRVQICIS